MVVVDGDSSIGSDGFDVCLIAGDGGVHLTQRGERYQGRIEGDGRGSSHDGNLEQGVDEGKGKVRILLIVHYRVIKGNGVNKKK